MKEDRHRKKKVIIISCSLLLLLGASMSAGYAIYFAKKDSNSLVELGKVDLDLSLDTDTVKTYSLLRTTSTDTSAFYYVGDSEDTKINNAVTGYYKYDNKEGGTFTNGGKVTYDLDNNILEVKGMSLGDKITFDLIVTNNSTIDVAYKLDIIDNNDDSYSKLIYEALNINILDKYKDYQAWNINTNNEETIQVEIEMPLKLKNIINFGKTSIKFEIFAIQKNLVIS